jgi:hypothetical protein
VDGLRSSAGAVRAGDVIGTGENSVQRAGHGSESTVIENDFQIVLGAYVASRDTPSAFGHCGEAAMLS